MGDNIALPDRDGVRTPMQWTGEENGGFSAAAPGRLLLPPNDDPVHGYRAINVDAQRRNPSSLLHWTRRMTHLRHQIAAFGLGDYQELPGSNLAVLAYARLYLTNVVICVNNLSRNPQSTELDLSPWAGHLVTELIGSSIFPAIDHHPYRVTLGPHGFYWLELHLPT